MVNLLVNFWNTLQSGQVPQWGLINYVLLMLLVIVEGPIATVMGAVAASAGYMKLEAVFAVAASGNLLADLGWYSLGYAGKASWALRIGQRFGLKQIHLDHIQQDFAEKAPRLLVLAKFTAAFTIPTLIAAGLAKLPFKRWLPAYILAEAIWTGLLALIGYHATQAILHMERGLQSFAIAAGAVFIVVIIFWLRRTMQKLPAFATSHDEGN
jgi:membrane protein DedA with SNARE-associated domain